jgi:hypothetical protein
MLALAGNWKLPLLFPVIFADFADFGQNSSIFWKF